jgi:hypothetical protein
MMRAATTAGAVPQAPGVVVAEGRETAPLAGVREPRRAAASATAVASLHNRCDEAVRVRERARERLEARVQAAATLEGVVSTWQADLRLAAAQADVLTHVKAYAVAVKEQLQASGDVRGLAPAVAEMRLWQDKWMSSHMACRDAERFLTEHDTAAAKAASSFQSLEAREKAWRVDIMSRFGAVTMEDLRLDVAPPPAAKAPLARPRGHGRAALSHLDSRSPSLYAEIDARLADVERTTPILQEMRAVKTQEDATGFGWSAMRVDVTTTADGSSSTVFSIQIPEAGDAWVSFATAPQAAVFYDYVMTFMYPLGKALDGKLVELSFPGSASCCTTKEYGPIDAWPDSAKQAAKAAGFRLPRVRQPRAAGDAGTGEGAAADVDAAGSADGAARKPAAKRRRRASPADVDGGGARAVPSTGRAIKKHIAQTWGTPYTSKLLKRLRVNGPEALALLTALRARLTALDVVYPSDRTRVDATQQLRAQRAEAGLGEMEDAGEECDPHAFSPPLDVKRALKYRIEHLAALFHGEKAFEAFRKQATSDDEDGAGEGAAAAADEDDDGGMASSGGGSTADGVGSPPPRGGDDEDDDESSGGQDGGSGRPVKAPDPTAGAGTGAAAKAAVCAPAVPAAIAPRVAIHNPGTLCYLNAALVSAAAAGLGSVLKPGLPVVPAAAAQAAGAGVVPAPKAGIVVAAMMTALEALAAGGSPLQLAAVVAPVAARLATLRLFAVKPGGGTRMRFVAGQQDDAQDALDVLIDDAISVCASGVGAKALRTCLIDTRLCGCGYDAPTPLDPGYGLILPVAPSFDVMIERLFSRNVGTVALDCDAVCPGCKRRGGMSDGCVMQTKLTVLDSTPELLRCTLRVPAASAPSAPSAAASPVQVPEELNLLSSLSSRLVATGATAKYRLASVVLHCGPDTYSGHYICRVRTDDGLWWEVDDHRMSLVAGPNQLRPGMVQGRYYGPTTAWFKRII